MAPTTNYAYGTNNKPRLWQNNQPRQTTPMAQQQPTAIANNAYGTNYQLRLWHNNKPQQTTPMAKQPTTTNHAYGTTTTHGYSQQRLRHQLPTTPMAQH
jgi:hypothetical protein